MQTAQQLSGAGATKVRQMGEAPFQANEIREYLTRAASALSALARDEYQAVAASLDSLGEAVEEHMRDLEDLERRLTALEEKMVAIAKSTTPDDVLVEIRRQLDSELSPYRGKMTADQIIMLERRYLDTRLLEREQLPRLSLFYMH
jgi:hypothetical protein